jgi:hypothetical protein
MKVRWSRGFLAFLRQFKLMQPQPSNELIRLWLLPEVFAFYWLWFYEMKISYREISQNRWWPDLQVDLRYMNEMLLDGQLRGWWNFQQAGEIVQFQPKFTSLEEWINHGLD